MTTATTPWLSDDEIANLCRPLQQNAARVRFIRREFGIDPVIRSDGSPVVMRSELERVKGADRLAANTGAHAAPNLAAVRALRGRV